MDNVPGDLFDYFASITGKPEIPKESRLEHEIARERYFQLHREYWEMMQHQLPSYRTQAEWDKVDQANREWQRADKIYKENQIVLSLKGAARTKYLKHVLRSWPFPGDRI